MSIRTPSAICILSISIFAVALTQDGFYLDHAPRNAWAPGWGEFAVGWISLFSGTLAWLGNPLLIASWITLFRGRVKLSALLAFFSLLFMLSFLLNKRIVINEAGSESGIAGYGLGYWLWILSALVAVGGAWQARGTPAAIAPGSGQALNPTPGNVMKASEQPPRLP